MFWPMKKLLWGGPWTNRSWPLLLALAGVGSYACGATTPPPADGLGASGGSIEVLPPASGGSGGSGGGSGGAPVVSLPPFDSCSLEGQGTVPASGPLMVDDFDDGDATLLGNGLHGNWYGFDDATGGTQTPSWDAPGGQWLPELGGIEPGGYAMHVVGGGFTYWGSGEGMSPIWDEGANQECLFDASAFDGITFWLKGEIDGSESSAADQDVGVLKFGFVEADVVPMRLGGNCDEAAGECYDWHKVRITPSECWVRYSFTFDQFEQSGWGIDGGEFDLDHLVNINFEVSQGNTFDYWMDELEFFSGDPPEDDELCEDGMGGGGGVGGAGGP
jgi:hypothetical protein